jgi:hypothetical protein
MKPVETLLKKLWDDYKELNISPERIQELLISRGETVINDHIALRTFDDPRVNIDKIAAPFMAGGYTPLGQYDFAEKKLDARHFQHPDPNLPLVFISQLRLRDFSPELNKMVARLLAQMPADLPSRPDFPVAGRPWNISYADYETLRAQSEYAAWVAAFGFRANHFTVLVNNLKGFPTLESLNDFLTEHNFRLNEVGGAIKGTSAVFLEQSSTMADRIGVNFSDGRHLIPACYYEFARRYKMPDGQLFRGFIETSANKIFESTNKGG